MHSAVRIIAYEGVKCQQEVQNNATLGNETLIDETDALLEDMEAPT